MSQRFVKYIDSEKGDWLAKKHPWAFMLLWLIAKRAKRTSTNLDGLEIGQAHIGDYKECGIPSEQIYRTAKQRLVDMGIILVCETCRTRKRATTDQRPTSKKSTTGATTVGTLVKLLDSSIWNINSEGDNDRSNDRSTTDLKKINDEQEIKKKEKKEKIKKEKSLPIEKISVREFVSLTQKEHDTLLATHGKDKFDTMLDILNSYKGRSGKEYKSDFSAMDKGSWVAREATQNPQKNSIPLWEANKDFAMKVQSELESSTCDLQVDASGVTFIPKVGQVLPYTLKYNENGFKDQIINNLKKREFKKRKAK